MRMSMITVFLVLVGLVGLFWGCEESGQEKVEDIVGRSYDPIEDRSPILERDIHASSDADMDVDADADTDADADADTDCLEYPEPPELPDLDFCSESCPCDFGQGDCDKVIGDVQCKGTLACKWDIGAAYGLPGNYDVCVSGPHCAVFDPGNPDGSFCSHQFDCYCGVGEGDCDRDEECGGRLVCGQDNGAASGLPSNWDVCMFTPQSGCPIFDRDDNDWSFCTESCPCGLGEGDCDNDNECRNNLVCAHDVGELFGKAEAWDVCAMPGGF